jgi:peptidoglycan L-alanyl-D-glutamate endopeptidase CwlK
MRNVDQITLQRIDKAHPSIRKILREQYIEISGQLPAFCRLRFSHVFRTPEEQRKLFLQRPKVTNADSWQSIHNYGLAFDIVLLYDNDRNGTFETASWCLKKDIDNDKTPEWTQVTNYFKSKGWTWGGDWTRFRDAPHFERPGFNWRKLKQLIDSNKTIVDNGITYPAL